MFGMANNSKSSFCDPFSMGDNNPRRNGTPEAISGVHNNHHQGEVVSGGGVEVLQNATPSLTNLVVEAYERGFVVLENQPQQQPPQRHNRVVQEQEEDTLPPAREQDDDEGRGGGGGRQPDEEEDARQHHHAQPPFLLIPPMQNEAPMIPGRRGRVRPQNQQQHAAAVAAEQHIHQALVAALDLLASEGEQFESNNPDSQQHHRAQYE